MKGLPGIENEEIDEEQDSEQFTSMLNAAKKQVGAENSAAAGQPLTQDQIEAMMGMDFGNDEGDAEAAPVEESPAVNEDGSESADNESAEGEGEEQEGVDTSEEGGKKKKGKKTKQKKEKKPINKVLIKRLAIVAAILIAGCVGFMVPILMFTDFIKSDNEKFAITAANAINSTLELNTSLYIYECYVNNGTAANECMLYGLTSLGSEEKLDIYRVVVEKDDPNTVNVYHTVDEQNPAFQNMLNSADREIAMQAVQLLYHYENTLAADKEIKSGSEKWEEVDCVVVNRNINSPQNNTKGKKHE